MAIQMIGIDHTKAVIDIRTIFSFTKKRSAEALKLIKEEKGIRGCVLISTCNRMELYVSTEEGYEGDLYELLCRVKELPEELWPEYREYFSFREEKEAASHLFRLAAGLESRILGEDQIITQVKDALAMARENYAADNVLEVLFRMAVTAAKRVKTEVVLTGASHSVIHQALATLKEKGFSVKGRKCMVIGNGAMGKLTASTLLSEGADVTVTVRQYRSGIVDIPLGRRRIDYGERMGYFPACDLVVSATASPNFTLKEENVRPVDLDHDLIVVDLAVPRDVEPGVGKLRHIRLYDIDDFHVDARSEQVIENLKKAEAILEEQRKEFDSWYECRDMVPRIQKLKKEAAEDLLARLVKIVHALPMETEQQETLLKDVEQAAEKSVNKMLFGLRDTVCPETFEECIEGLEKTYEG